MGKSFHFFVSYSKTPSPAPYHLWGEAGAKFAHSRKGRKGGRVEGGGGGGRREMRREER